MKFKLFVIGTAVALMAAALAGGCGSRVASSPQDPTVEKDFVFGDERGFDQCHASTLVKLRDGHYLTAWFGGTREGKDDVGVWMSKGSPGNWQEPFRIAKVREDAHWNPVLFSAPEGTIYLYFKVGKTIMAWETWYITSDDGGTTWSEARELVPGDQGGRGPVRNKPIVLSDGTWLAGASYEDQVNKLWDAFVDRSTDGGRTWEATPYLTLDRELVKGNGIIQPTLWESEPGKVHMLLRSTTGVICRSDSDDYGKTWSPVYLTDLPNPNSGIDLAQLPGNILVLLYNPDNRNWGSRARLHLAVSYDNGITWPLTIPVEEGETGDEYSYPAMVASGDTAAFTYTWNRQRIMFGKAYGLTGK